MTASDSSSSAVGPSELPAARPPLPAAWLRGDDLDLLAPATFVTPGSEPRPGAPGLDRREIAAALDPVNRSYGHPEAGALAEKLARPETRVVIAGQQPGLFGGPLYTLLKMAAVTRWAARLEASGTPAVGLFWIATEDHDWDEIATAAFWHRDSAVRVGLGPDEHPLVPLGLRTLGDGVTAALDELDALFPYEPFASWLAELRGWYRPDARVGEAFARAAVGLLGERCPLLVDSLLPALKAAQRPWLQRLVERRGEIESAIGAAETEVTERGYPLQVHPSPGAAPLFLLCGSERRRIVWEGDDRFSVRGLDGTRAVAELLETIEDNPTAVSANVLSRPAIQDAVFGTSLQILGPGELSYLAQASAVYEPLGVAAPHLAMRPQAMVVESKQLAVLERLELPASIVTAAEADVDARLADDSVTAFVSEAVATIEEVIDGLREPAVAVDPSLEKPWRRTRDHLVRGLGTFADKVTRAAAHRDEVERRRLDTLRAFAQPSGSPHERVLSGAYFRGRWGTGFGEALWEAIDLDLDGTRVVVDPDGGPQEVTT